MSGPTANRSRTRRTARRLVTSASVLLVLVGTLGGAAVASAKPGGGAGGALDATPHHEGPWVHPRDLPPGAERPDPDPPYRRMIPARDVKNRPTQVDGTVAAIAGTAFLPVILVDFSDNVAESSLHTPAAYRAMLFDRNHPHGAGSMRDYYVDQSGGLFDVTGAVSNTWLRMPRTYAAYVGSSYGYQTTEPNDWTLVRDAVAAADSTMNFCSGDTDGDGFVDSLFVVHAGPGAEEAGSGIWSVRWALPQAYTTQDTCANGQRVKVKDFTIQPEEHVDARYTAPGAPDRLISIGVFVHEFGHALGLPDLYDIDGSSSGGVGAWDVMASGSWGFGGRPWRPTPFSAWTKTALGWAIPANVTADRLAQAIASADAPRTGAFTGIFRLARGGSATSQEYFLVENRQAIGWAANFPTGGLAIWHVDESRRRTDNRDNADDTRRLLHLLQADGRDDLGLRGTADAGDLFPGSSNARTLSWSTNPSTMSYDGTRTGVEVARIGNAGATTTADLIISGPLGTNDNFAGALPLASSEGTLLSSNAAATRETGEPAHAGNGPHKSIWFYFTAPRAGSFDINTSGSSFDTLLAVYTGTAVNALTHVASNDDVSSSDRTSRLTDVSLTAGVTYRIAVDGYGGASGTVQLSWRFVPSTPDPTFADVPTTHPFYREIEELYARGITTGCGTNSSGQLLYCPLDDVRRQAMAAFIVRAMGLTLLTPALATFADVPTTHQFFGQIERFYEQGITTGCATNPLRFCPLENVKRQAMAAFIVRAKGLTPLTPAIPTFADVPTTHPFYGQIERFYQQGITTGCGTNPSGQLLFCPDATVKRQAMAAFLVRAFPAT
jgi:M6 family metalloprotease-like protein